MTMSRDHFAADVAVIATQARLIECRIRQPNSNLHAEIAELNQLTEDCDAVTEKWASRMENQRWAQGKED